MKTAFIFPGQGSQKIGMGKDLYTNFSTARQVFEEVDSALSQNLSALMFNGTEAELNLTANAQPALMAVSMAAFKVLQEKTGDSLSDMCSYVAGHSLGEYSALCAAGCFDVQVAAKLLRIRGEAMQEAVPGGKGSMAALLGIDMKDATQIAAEAQGEALKTHFGEVCVAANDNAPGQVVISGTTLAVDLACQIAKNRGVLKTVILPVSVPAHSPLLKSAADRMAQALAEITLNEPAVPLIANVTATEVIDPKIIKNLLVQQVTGTVRWRESMIALAEKGVTTLVEIGSGKVLAGLAKRIDKRLKTINIEDAQTLELSLAVR